MTDDPASPPPPPRPLFQTSAVCADDFGLKAGFWSRKNDEPVYFRPIVGWVTITNFVEAGLHPFVPVVLNDMGFPTFAADGNFPDYIGVFAKALTPVEARAKAAAWLPSAGAGSTSGGGHQQSQTN